MYDVQGVSIFRVEEEERIEEQEKEERRLSRKKNLAEKTLSRKKK